MSNTVTVNDALVQLDNLINAANYLIEELETRKAQMTSQENILEEVKTQMDESWFRGRVVDHIRNNFGNGICREVAFYVMERIDADIEAFINDRVNKAIAQANGRSSN